MDVKSTTGGLYIVNPNTDERNALKHLAEALNITTEAIVAWIVSYELLKYYQEIGK